jgi:hypothetical protein
MKLSYFDFLDYRKIKKIPWYETGLELDLQRIFWTINHPEYFEDGDLKEPLFYPIPIHESDIYPYTLEEINLIEEGVNFKFPQAFKELMFLFGGAVFKGRKLIGYLSDKKNGKRNRLDLERDIKNLNINQADFRNIYQRLHGNACPTHLFVTHLIEGIVANVISNKEEGCPIYYYTHNIFGENIVEISQFKRGTILYELREELEVSIIGYYTSAPAIKILMEKLINSKMFDAGWKIFKTSFYVHLSSIEKNKNAYILIEYDDMPDFHAKSIMNENADNVLITFNFREVIKESKRVVVSILNFLKKNDLLS